MRGWSWSAWVPTAAPPGPVPFVPLCSDATSRACPAPPPVPSPATRPECRRRSAPRTSAGRPAPGLPAVTCEPLPHDLGASHQALEPSRSSGRTDPCRFPSGKPAGRRTGTPAGTAMRFTVTALGSGGGRSVERVVEDIVRYLDPPPSTAAERFDPQQQFPAPATTTRMRAPRLAGGWVPRNPSLASKATWTPLISPACSPAATTPPARRCRVLQPAGDDDRSDLHTNPTRLGQGTTTPTHRFRKPARLPVTGDLLSAHLEICCPPEGGIQPTGRSR